VLTLVGGEVVHGEGEFAALAPALPPVSPSWSPVARFGGAAPTPPQRPPPASAAAHAHAGATLGCDCFVG